MEPESSSFWSEIKKYEDILAKDPQSYCFAPLSELYRKMGLLDDALNVAKRGCEIHPDYVGGFMALGRAYYEKGMKTESRAALESVVRGTPDNLLAQKFLSQLYIEEGEPAAAEIALRTILSLNPGDSESQVLLESLKNASATRGTQLSENSTGVLSTVTADSGSVQEFPDEEVLLEELEVVDDFANETTSAEEAPLSAEIFSYSVQSETDSAAEAFDEFFLNEDTEPAAKKMAAHATAGGEDDEESALPAVAEETLQFAEESAFPEGKDPLTTVTLAELYISQGFLKRALTIYRELLTVDPDNEELRQRLMDLKLTIDRDEASARVSALEDDCPAPESSDVAIGIFPLTDKEEVARATGTDDEVLTTLEKWLENVSRRRQ